jgi:hypothetical protein
LIERCDHLMPWTHSRLPGCIRFRKRPYKYRDEQATFLDDPAVLADHNGTGREVRAELRGERSTLPLTAAPDTS